jgi:hypothetical protein
MNNIIICDTREKGNKKILEYFDKIGQDYIISKLDAGDYMIYKNYETIIDKKDGLLEVCNNLCHTNEHNRVVKEVELAHKRGCKNFIFLIQQNGIKSVEDIKNWSSSYTKVKGETLLKIMNTFKEHHQCRFVIVSKKDIPKKIIELLNNLS